jgi:RNA polymerase subunit RPABC4/transcription elongation factor Spt4
MAIQFLEALTGKHLKCPVCGSQQLTSRNYKAHFKVVNYVGSVYEKEFQGDSVTLICRSCGWEEHTENWRNYLTTEKTFSYYR